MIEKIKHRMALLQEVAPQSVGVMLDLKLLGYDELRQEYILQGKTFSWMQNGHGTLHGGFVATFADHAMGLVSNCVLPGDGVAPAIELHMNYHRPLIPGEDVLIRVRLRSVTKSLLHTSAELFRASAPDKLCASGQATYFYKPKVTDR